MELVVNRFLADTSGQTPRLIVNGKAKSVRANGRQWLVAPVTMIVPGVLPGSKGPLLYTPEDTRRYSSNWDGVPITHNHPFDPITNDYLSAGDPGVSERQQIGVVRSPKFDGKQRAMGWFDAEQTKGKAPEVYEALMNGQPMELSTGLFTDNEPSSGVHQGRQYTHIARNWKPDHLAILPNQTGACSTADGCGLHVVNTAKGQLLVRNCNCGGTCGKCGSTNNYWSDAAREASIQARKASGVATKASHATPTQGKSVREARSKSLDADDLHGAGHHEEAGNLHRDASESHSFAAVQHFRMAENATKVGDSTAASRHYRAAKLHDNAANAHDTAADKIATRNANPEDRKPTVNPFQSESQRRACYGKRAAGETGWDCDEWEGATPRGKKLPERKKVKNKTAAHTSNDANFASEDQRRFMWSQHPDIAEDWAHGEHSSDGSTHRMPGGPGSDVKGPAAKAARERLRKKKGKKPVGNSNSVSNPTSDSDVAPKSDLAANIWSDAARSAAIEARRAMMHAGDAGHKEGKKASSDAEHLSASLGTSSHEFKQLADAHMHAAKTHEALAKSAGGGASASHELAAENHREAAGHYREAAAKSLRVEKEVGDKHAVGVNASSHGKQPSGANFFQAAGQFFRGLFSANAQPRKTATGQYGNKHFTAEHGKRMQQAAEDGGEFPDEEEEDAGAKSVGIPNGPGDDGRDIDTLDKEDADPDRDGDLDIDGGQYPDDSNRPYAGQPDHDDEVAEHGKLAGNADSPTDSRTALINQLVEAGLIEEDSASEALSVLEGADVENPTAVLNSEGSVVVDTNRSTAQSGRSPGATAKPPSPRAGRAGINSNARKTCPDCGGKVVDGECEDCGKEVTSNVSNANCLRVQTPWGVFVINAGSMAAFQGAKDAGYSPSEAAAMAGKLEGSYQGGASESAHSASKKAEKAGTAGAHKKAAAAHREAAEKAKDEGDSALAKQHANKAASHLRTAKKLSNNISHTVESLVGAGVLNEFQREEALAILNAKAEGSNADVTGSGDFDDAIEAGGYNDRDDDEDDRDDEKDEDGWAAGGAIYGDKNELGTPKLERQGKPGMNSRDAENEWLRKAPAEVRDNYARMTAAKKQIANSLTANIRDPQRKRLMFNSYMQLTFDELRSQLPDAGQRNVSRNPAMNSTVRGLGGVMPRQVQRPAQNRQNPPGTQDQSVTDNAGPNDDQEVLDFSAHRESMADIVKNQRKAESHSRMQLLDN